MSAFTSRIAAIGVCFGLVLALAASAVAQPQIRAGSEQEMLRLFAPYSAGAAPAPGWSLTGIAAQQDHLVVTLTGPEGRSLVSHWRPSSAEVGHQAGSFSVSVVGETPDAAMVETPALQALMQAAVAYGEPTFWTTPTATGGSGTPPPSPPGVVPPVQAEAPGAPWLATLLLLVAFALAFGTWRMGRRVPSRSWTRRFVGASAGLFATLGVAELGLIAAGVTPPAPARAAQEDREFVDESVNGLGIRHAWDEIPERKVGETRIAIVGDSFTFGEAVAEPYVFPTVLETLANEVFTDRTVRVFNLGVPGDGTPEELVRLQALIGPLDLDIVVLAAYLNDFTSGNPQELIDRVYRGDYQRHPLFGRTRLYAVADTTYRNRIVRRDAIQYYRSSIAHDVARNFDGQFADIGHMRDLCRDHGVAFRLMLFPWLFELDDYPVAAFHTALGEYAGAADIPFLDLLDVYRGMDADTLRVSPANEHPNAAAHRLAAAGVLRFLADDLAESPAAIQALNARADDELAPAAPQ